MTQSEDQGTESGHPSGTLDEADVQRAQALATSAHHGQTDQADRPYIGHPSRVVGYLVNPTPQESVVAWLHDVVEDSGATLQGIRDAFGSQVADAIDAITCRPPEEANLDAYYARVKANPIALTVKAADIADNTDPARLQLLDPKKRAELEAKYAHARHELGIA